MSPDTQTNSWIQRTPGICGGDACIRNTRHSVAGLVQWRKLGLTDSEIICHHPDLTQQDLNAAWEYYEKHAKEVELAIRDDETA